MCFFQIATHHCAAAVRSISFCSPRRARLRAFLKKCDIYFLQSKAAKLTFNKMHRRSDESDDAFFKQYGRTVEQGARPVSRDVALLTTCRQSAASRKQLSNLT
ncbi:hypothetical protein T01_1690 [Trichinella spiralis]|uniref:Uncharacterized protein n=1 Tax=Trichinella spiralis TaxID=6334 RepID=A0A0V1AVR7_TRISP|nr:hypothetical protein T01_1690 [Trichinella spiralis]